MKEKEEIIIPDSVNKDGNKIIPEMEVKINPQEHSDIVSDEALNGLYDEILLLHRNDRGQADELLLRFLEMVSNDGDGSSATKEAIVNLMKIKSEAADKMTKIADLKTRIKLKDRDTFPRYLAAQQNNKITIETSKRDFLKGLNKELKKIKGKHE